jgi:hypothetical protein
LRPRAVSATAADVILTLLTGLRLLLPAMVPSWRFFNAVGDSPRIDHAVTTAPDAPDPTWVEVRDRVARLSLAAMARRMVWNPDWNEGLFLVSLAERLVTSDDPHTVAHSERELLMRVARRVPAPSDAWLRVRVRLVGRDEECVVHVSAAHRLSNLTTR